MLPFTQLGVGLEASAAGVGEVGGGVGGPCAKLAFKGRWARFKDGVSVCGETGFPVSL